MGQCVCLCLIVFSNVAFSPCLLRTLRPFSDRPASLRKSCLRTGFIPGADEAIIRTLTRLGMVSDIPVVWQSRRYELYEQALGKLSHQGLVYGCACSRKEIATAQARLGLPSHVYPGTCRNGTHGKPPRSLRVRTFDEVVSFDDRRCGHFSENLEHDVGDFVVKRADGLWAYQLAVVVDDAQQGVTDIVRGEDLLNNTPRQIYLQRKLGLSIPQYLHIALALDAHGQKLRPKADPFPPIRLHHAVFLLILSRQIIALHSTVGRLKTEVMKERILDINPLADVRRVDAFYLPENADAFDFSEYSYAVDAVDTVTAKIDIVLRAQAAGTPVISCMGAGNKLDPAAFRVADIFSTSVCPLARVMRSELKKRGIRALKVVYSTEKPITPVPPEGAQPDPSSAHRRQTPGSISFVPSVAGLIAAGEVIKDLIKS